MQQVRQNKGQKQVTPLNKTSELAEELKSTPHFYQPAYRYEEPFWMNREISNPNKHFENKKLFNGNLGRNLEIISSSNEIYKYLLNLALDNILNKFKDDNDKNKWNMVNTVLQGVINNKNAILTIGSRHGNRLTISEQNFQFQLLSKEDVINPIREGFIYIYIEEGVLRYWSTKGNHNLVSTKPMFDQPCTGEIKLSDIISTERLEEGGEIDETDIFKSQDKIISMIDSKGDLPKPGRFTLIPSIEHMSLGQSTLFNLFVNIIYYSEGAASI